MSNGLVASIHVLILAALLSANASGSESGFVPASSSWLEQKTIKDPAEYNAYLNALNLTDPAAKAAAMEAFVTKYPESVVKTDALEQAMAAYQQAGDVPKVEQAARRLADADPFNSRPLAVLTVLARQAVTQGNNSRLPDLCTNAMRGVVFLNTWTKPDGLSDAGFAKLRNQVTEVFYGGVGFCRLQEKAYDLAREYYLKALQINPQDMSNNYQLGIAELEPTPLDPNGFWYVAKAVSLAQAQQNATAAGGIAQYGKAKYKKFHGSDDGWDALVSAAAQQSSPPRELAALNKAPTPAEIACQAVRENNPADLSFSDMEFVLQQREAAPCNIEAADKVWNAIQDKERHGEAKLQIPVKVISSSKNTIAVAITDENQQANQADMEVTMEGPMANPPVSGAMIDVIGVITKYRLDPFFFVMEQGELGK